ncbi:hypothetical protein HMPREF6745_0858 [Prevotella sp. oral taxon 472 str. F0295]|nr:hypothetical protein HMPREF6745_0858 [Prevotella sp. oral taxon 472 str. F0295]
MQLNSYGLEPLGFAGLFDAGCECKVTQNRCGDICCENRM